MSAGPPEAPPLIPGIAGMTERVVTELGDSDLGEAFSKVRTNLAMAGAAPPNVEDYLTHVRLLAEVARQSSSTLSDLDHPTLVALDHKICKVIAKLATVDLLGTKTPYHHLAAWVRGTTRVIPVELFTTNYDLLLEQSLEELRVPYFDGFSGSREAFFDPHAIEAEQEAFPPRWARLWKLHGSINWWARSATSPSEVVRSMKEAGESLLVHPSHLKYDESRQMPYLAMMDRLKAFLRRPAAVLVTCGYSFRDRHINALLWQALAGNPDATMFALVRSNLEKYPTAIELATTTPNLSLLARGGGIIGVREAKWSAREPADKAPPGVAIEAGAPNEQMQVEVHLGDFAQLGYLLQDMIGGPREYPLSTHGGEPSGG